MPEGDTVWLTARNLNTALAGQVLTGCDLRVPALSTIDLTGETIHEVRSRGKHLLFRIGDVTLHSHLKMEGAWHLYRPDTPWRRPTFEARAVLRTEEWTAVGFALGILELVTREEEHTVVGHLGPDLLGEWDEEDALARLRSNPSVPIFVALLEQRNLAGIGNEYANELCFLSGLLPTRPVGEVKDLPKVLALARRLLQANRDRVERTTTGDTRPGNRAWVYGRAGKPCRRCGTPIQTAKLGPTPLLLRDSYWCSHCQT